MRTWEFKSTWAHSHLSRLSHMMRTGGSALCVPTGPRVGDGQWVSVELGLGGDAWALESIAVNDLCLEQTSFG